jgi:phosphatidylinositol glycan class Q protein
LAVQQLDLRAAQLAFLTHEAVALRQPGGVAVDVFSARYTKCAPPVWFRRLYAASTDQRIFYFSFFNTVWLILNDLTIGVGVGSFLCENRAALAGMLGRFGEVRVCLGALFFAPLQDRWSSSSILLL